MSATLAKAPRPAAATGVGVVRRITQLLDAFVDAPGHLLLEELTGITGLPRSTAFRLLGQLIDQGWVTHDARGYALGPRASLITTQAHSQKEIRVTAHEQLNTLHLRTRAVAHLWVLTGGFIYCLDKVGGLVDDSVPTGVGTRIPAADSAGGRALLATMAPEAVYCLLADVHRRALSESEQNAVHQRLAAVRAQRGVASEQARNRNGVSAVAVPVTHRGQGIAAVSLAWRGALANADAVVPQLFTAAGVIRARLGS
ncbi:IclR family transcriptional regulator [Streptomyces hirsutus]|uniref:IclR family transcriptional regulator n=1 Tax=Streptomyces hirsutus TaxID=35620 RepID=UPI0006E2EC81|nr:helix-turn-helix domain-containing protein [Streptomyces hirsutus]